MAGSTDDAYPSELPAARGCPAPWDGRISPSRALPALAALTVTQRCRMQHLPQREQVAAATQVHAFPLAAASGPG